MNNKMIFFDIDGTIIDHYNNCIPKSALNALKTLKDSKHYPVIASGKGPVFIENMFSDFRIETYIAYNGNYVKYQDKVIYENYIDSEIVKEIESYALINNITFVQSDVSGTTSMFKDDSIIKSYYQEFNLPYPPIIDKISDYTKYFQISIMVDKHQEIALREHFPLLSFVRMNKYGLNALPLNSLKDKGILKLLDYTKHPLQDTIAFGDGLNDISMFKLVNQSVAMGNAETALKEVASYVSDHISNDGLEKGCIELGIIEKDK